MHFRAIPFSGWLVVFAAALVISAEASRTQGNAAPPVIFVPKRVVGQS